MLDDHSHRDAGRSHDELRHRPCSHPRSRPSPDSPYGLKGTFTLSGVALLRSATLATYEGKVVPRWSYGDALHTATTRVSRIRGVCRRASNSRSFGAGRGRGGPPQSPDGDALRGQLGGHSADRAGEGPADPPEPMCLAIRWAWRFLAGDQFPADSQQFVSNDAGHSPDGQDRNLGNQRALLRHGNILLSDTSTCNPRLTIEKCSEAAEPSGSPARNWPPTRAGPARRQKRPVRLSRHRFLSRDSILCGMPGQGYVVSGGVAEAA